MPGMGHQRQGAVAVGGCCMAKSEVGKVGELGCSINQVKSRKFRRLRVDRHKIF
jgi:hypothetical protein